MKTTSRTTGNVRMPDDQTVAILGGRGMLGTDVTDTCRREGLQVEALDLPEFDVTNTKQLEQVVQKADIIINCAAYTNVDKAESEFDLAHRVNAEAVGRLGTLAKKKKKWVLHISTDFVFDGRSGHGYAETDQSNPLNAYGKTKLAGEQLLEESGCDYCILRIQWTYGHAGTNFVNKLTARARDAKDLRVVDDQIGSPTATTEVAEAICRLMQLRPAGYFHFAAAGCVSRFETAEFIVRNLDLPVNLSRCKSSDFPAAAVRPRYSCFNCDKIQTLLDKPIKLWQEPLKHFLEQL